jgi:eukaryotic-like serine/threonine-protein kinase
MGDRGDGPSAPIVSNDPLAGTAYRTLGYLGRGGMAMVLEAEHLPLGRRVVVKLLHEQLATDPQLVDRLRIEARSLALVQHPNVVAVSDFGCTPGGRPFLVTELLEGRTLGAELRERGAFPVAEAIAVLLQVLAGLEAAHRRGIVHRDVKPENIFRCQEPGPIGPLVKVLDFGIAKVLEGSRARGLTPAYPTAEGCLMGSPRYIAPEQARCRRVDERTDVYAAGLVLHALLTGRAPFAQHRDAPSLLCAHVLEELPPASRCAAQPIPAELDRILARAVAKRPEDRFQRAAEFAEALLDVVGSPVVRVPSIVDAAPFVGGGADETTIARPVQPRAGRAGLGTDRLLALVMVASAMLFSLVILMVAELLGARR